MLLKNSALYQGKTLAGPKTIVDFSDRAEPVEAPLAGC
jgi:hypothetical protein